ncbi:TetR/AcrR family transcriptional regulator [Nocardiopsis aegyptia]|uniref:TetR/AcrR family transcriptional regulator n=1 Tax=Nocardiopsis aegyptia TaxID=220378 RepID=UPI00366FD650
MPPVPGRPRSAEADRAILDAALDLLVERGVEGTSIERVAQHAGVTRATVYRRYPDKTRLLLAALQAGLATPAELPACDSVEEMLSLWARGLGGPDAVRGRRLLRRMMTGLHDHPELHRAYREASIARRERWIRTVLEQARERGEFPAEADLAVVGDILTSAVTTHLLTRPDTSTVREVEDYLLSVLRHTCYRRQP